jgi:hypothetical protein
MMVSGFRGIVGGQAAQCVKKIGAFPYFSPHTTNSRKSRSDQELRIKRCYAGLFGPPSSDMFFPGHPAHPLFMENLKHPERLRGVLTDKLIQELRSQQIK